MVTNITLQISSEALANIKETQSNILEVLKNVGGTLKPLHPHSRDPELQRFFIVGVPVPSDAEKIIGRLRQVPGVEAAYVKPLGEPP